MTCNSRCWFAKSEPDKCKCSCNGKNHGHGHPEKEEQENELIEIVLSKTEKLQYYRQMDRRFTCYCGYEGLWNLPIYGYSHPDGWKIRNGKYWLWVHCPKCGHDWSLWKLGVFRELQKQLDLGGYI